MQQIRTEETIEASPDDVWDVITDFEEYPRWNPFVRRIEGTIAVGSRLEVVLAVTGRKPTTVRPLVTSADAGTRFSWLGRMGIRGLFDGHHVFELVGDGSATHLVHREEFTGILVPLLMPLIRRVTTEGFEAMNAALKARVQATVSS